LCKRIIGKPVTTVAKSISNRIIDNCREKKENFSATGTNLTKNKFLMMKNTAVFLQLIY
jgi:hypothetical protein